MLVYVCDRCGKIISDVITEVAGTPVFDAELGKFRISVNMYQDYDSEASFCEACILNILIGE